METSTFFRMCDIFAPLTVEVSSRPPVITLLFPLHTSFFPSFGGGRTPQDSRLPTTAVMSAPVVQVLSNMAMPRWGIPFWAGPMGGKVAWFLCGWDWSRWSLLERSVPAAIVKSAICCGSQLAGLNTHCTKPAVGLCTDHMAPAMGCMPSAGLSMGRMWPPAEPVVGCMCLVELVTGWREDMPLFVFPAATVSCFVGVRS